MPKSPELPLTPLTMAILLALAKGDQHGYALMQEVEAQTGGAIIAGTGSLYSALQRLQDDGLIADSPDRPAAGEDQRRRYFRITDAGRAAARAEAARMARVLEMARESRLIPKLGSLRGTR
jgi:DNA-binding PadR family transcriptional regulator